jgi:DNA-directed RNA polymerase subunit RPC12/RpoP
MRPLHGELLLQAWERGARQNAMVRAIVLLAIAGTERTRDEWECLSLPERDAELLRLRGMTFGDELRGYVPCSRCSTRVEFQASVAELVTRVEAMRPPSELHWQAGRYRFLLRPAGTRDLLHAAAANDGRRGLLQACVTTDIEDREEALTRCEEGLTEQFNRLHEGAETQLTVRCPDCGAVENVDLDIGRFLWNEVGHAAVSTMREVHELASTYGWAEACVLEMSRARREMYLEMARHERFA